MVSENLAPIAGLLFCKTRWWPSIVRGIWKAGAGIACYPEKPPWAHCWVRILLIPLGPLGGESDVFLQDVIESRLLDISGLTAAS